MAFQPTGCIPLVLLRPMAEPKATHDFSSDDLTAALDFLRRIRDELSTVRMVRVWPERLQVLDANY